MPDNEQDVEEQDAADESLPATGFDLNDAQSASELEDQGTIVDVKTASGDQVYYTSPTGDRRKATITVAGRLSKLFKKADNAQRDSMLRRRAKKLTGEQLGRQQLELTAACVMSWEGIYLDGKPLPLTKENIIMVLDRAPWIRDDVEAAMNDHQSFFSDVSPS